MRRSFIIALLLQGFITGTTEISAQVGGTSGSYLRAGVGVRALGMGGAHVGLVNDVTAGYWNPAGLVQVSEPQLYAMYSPLSLDRHFSYVAAAKTFKNIATFAVSFINYGVGNIQSRDPTGALTGQFSNSENAIIFSGARQLSQFISYGASVKLVFHSLAGSNAFGAGFDIGMLFEPTKYVAIGASFQDIYTKISWNTPANIGETFPSVARLGVNLKPFPFMNLAFDYEINSQSDRTWHFGNADDERWHFGAEVFATESWALRIGSDAGNLAFGSSLIVPVRGSLIEFGYSFAVNPFDRSPAQNFALLLKFGTPQREAFEEESEELLDFNIPSPEGKYTVLFAQVFGVEENSIIINVGKTHFIRAGMQLQIYRMTPESSTGRFYGTAKVVEPRYRYSLIRVSKRRGLAELSVGDKIAVRYKRE